METSADTRVESSLLCVLTVKPCDCSSDAQHVHDNLETHAQDNKRDMGVEIQSLKTEIRALKQKLSDDESRWGNGLKLANVALRTYARTTHTCARKCEHRHRCTALATAHGDVTRAGSASFCPPSCQADSLVSSSRT
jgi:hypothetical protein